MGKIYDAMEKSGSNKKLKVISSVKNDPPPIRDLAVAESASEPAARDSAAAGRPPEAGPLDPVLVAYHAPGTMEAEIFKILRANILFPKEGHPPRSIMVTSAIPGDGKSFVAANLAISIARGVEEHVLLMDCDMRRSSIHHNFGFPETVPGLSDHLSRGVELPELLRKTCVDKLTILPGGAPPENPSELLSSQAMKHLLEETKNRYSDRFIIVDSPPPQLTAETTALAKHIDGILIVIRSGSTPRAQVNELVEKLGREKILGVVLNGYRVPATERYGYGRYKSYENGYKKKKQL
jgi:exopolysaccharide/PEP-CTERM locus tyrosine autokinase